MSDHKTFRFLPGALHVAIAACILTIAGCSDNDSNPVVADFDQDAANLVAAKKCATPPCGGGGGDDGGGSPADPELLFQREFTDIWVANADGSNQTELIQAQESVFTPSWSPTSNSFVYWTITSADVFEMWAADVSVVDGVPVAGNVHLIQTGGKVPQYSADGSRLVFVSSDDRSVEVIPATGGSPTTLYTAPAGYGVGLPSVDPTGGAIAFVERDTNWVDHAIKRIAIDVSWNVTGISTVVGFGQFEDIRVTYEPNGTHLLFSGTEPGSGTTPGSTTSVWVRRVAETGGAVTDVVEGGWPSAKPDGSGFSYSSRGIRFYDLSSGSSSVLIRKAANWSDFK